MKPDSARQSSRHPGPTRKELAQRVGHSRELVRIIAEFLPTPYCRDFRRVSLSWYQTLSNVIARRSLSKQPLYRNVINLSTRVEQRPQGARAFPSQKVSRLDKTRQEINEAMYSTVRAQHDKAVSQLGILKQQLWETCRIFKSNNKNLAGCAPWRGGDAPDPDSARWLPVPRYFERPMSDMPSPATLCLQLYAVCWQLYPTQAKVGSSANGASLEFNGITPLPPQPSLTLIEQMIDCAQRMENPAEPWRLEAPKRRHTINAALRPTEDAGEPDWALLAYLSHEHMTEALDGVLRLADIDDRVRTKMYRLDDVLDTWPNALPFAYEIVRHLRATVPRDLVAPLLEMAMARHDWSMMDHVLGKTIAVRRSRMSTQSRVFTSYDLVPWSRLPKNYACLSEDQQEKCIKFLLSAPLPESEAGKIAVEHIFHTIFSHQGGTLTAWPPRAAYAVCLQFFTKEDAQPDHPVHQFLLECDATAHSIAHITDKAWATPAFARTARHLLDTLLNGTVQIRIAEPLLMTLIAAADDSQAYRTAIERGLLFDARVYSNAPYAGPAFHLSGFKDNLTPLHAMLKFDAVQVLTEALTPVFLYSDTTLLMNGKQRSLDDCARLFKAKRIARCLAEGGIPDTFSSPEQAEMALRNFLSHHPGAIELPADMAWKRINTATQLRHIDTLIQLGRKTEQASRLAASLCKCVNAYGDPYQLIPQFHLMWTHALEETRSTETQRLLGHALACAAKKTGLSLGSREFEKWATPVLAHKNIDLLCVALTMPNSYASLNLSLIVEMLTQCLSSDMQVTQANYLALRAAFISSRVYRKALYRDRHIDPALCVLLTDASVDSRHTSTGNAPIVDQNSRATRLLTHLTPLFGQIPHTTEAFGEAIEKRVQEWLGYRAGSERASQAKNSLQSELIILLNQIVRSKLSVDEDRAIFHALCIVNQKELAGQMFHHLGLDAAKLEAIAQQDGWDCLETMALHDATEVVRALPSASAYPQRWVSPEDVCQLLMQHKGKGTAVISLILETLSRRDIKAFFKTMISLWPEAFHRPDSELVSMLRAQAKRAHGLTAQDVQQLLERSKPLQGEDIYGAIRKTLSS